LEFQILISLAMILTRKASDGARYQFRPFSREGDPPSWQNRNSLL